MEAVRPSRTGSTRPRSRSQEQDPEESISKFKKIFLDLLAPTHDPLKFKSSQPANDVFVEDLNRNITNCAVRDSRAPTDPGPLVRSNRSTAVVENLAITEGSSPLQPAVPNTHENAPSASVAASRASTSDSTSNVSERTVSTISTSPPTKQVTAQLFVVCQIEKDLYVAPDIKMTEEQCRDFRNICGLLDSTLQHTFYPKRNCNDPVSYELMMAGPSRCRFKPSILVVCCSEAHKKQLKKIIKGLKWVKDYSFYWRVIVDPVQKLSRGIANLDRYEVAAIVPLLSGSPVGVAAEARGQQDGLPIIFTVGGMILVDGEAYFLTTGHSFHLDDQTPDREADSELSLDNQISDHHLTESDSDDDSESPFAFSEDSAVCVIESQNVQTLDIIAKKSCQNDKPREVDAPPESKYPATQIGRVASHSHQQGHPLLDWALINPLDLGRWSENSVLLPHDPVSTIITSTLEFSEPCRGEVWIAGGVSGLVKGVVHHSPAFLHLDKSSFEVWQIMPDKPMVPGDSGAWVVQDGRLQGHIVAGRTQTPWVYMVRIDAIFAEIARWTSAKEVRLPRVGELRQKLSTKSDSILTKPNTLTYFDIKSPATLGTDPKSDPIQAKIVPKEMLSTRFRRPLRTDPFEGPERNESLNEIEEERFIPLLSPDMTSTSIKNYSLTVTGSLPTEQYLHDDLIRHLRALDITATATATVLEYIWLMRQRVTIHDIFMPKDAAAETAVMNAAYEVYALSKGEIFPRVYHSQDISYEGNNYPNCLHGLWNTLLGFENQRMDTVGRAVILREPDPSMLAMAHLALRPHFDVEEIYGHLVGNQDNSGMTKALMSRAFERLPVRQRSFIFAFKYYTLVDEGISPAAWQRSNLSARTKARNDYEIDIAECSSVLGLSLAGPPLEVATRRGSRRQRSRGVIFDTCAPWYLVNIQFYPDDRSSVPGYDSDYAKTFANGPHAFLNALAVEYRDAVTRFTALHDRIIKLVIRNGDLIFNPAFRDDILFEDDELSHMRRYFWAYTTLSALNESIEALITAYTSTFTDEFWKGHDPLLWAVPPAPSPRHSNSSHIAEYEASVLEYLQRLEIPRQKLEHSIIRLRSIQDRNQAAMRKISDLRDHLQVGSAAMESRRAIQQGDNIRIFTGLSLLFLPLTFVTSVFGMTNMSTSPEDWAFPFTMITVGLPCIALIVLLQSRRGMALLKAPLDFIRDPLGRRTGSAEGSKGNRAGGQQTYSKLNGNDSGDATCSADTSGSRVMAWARGGRARDLEKMAA